MIFTTNQKRAIDMSLGEDTCVVAGPGSGKTSVLVERYGRLVESGIPPREILAITFTEKAATNMKAKMARRFEHDPELRRQIEGAYISTVHGYCQRVLKENAIAAGVDPQFEILDERQGQIRRARCAVESLDGFLRERRDEALRLMAAISQEDLADRLVDVHDAVRNAGMPMDSLYEPTVPDLGGLLCDLWAVIEQYSRFDGRLSKGQRELRDELLEWSERSKEVWGAGRIEELLEITKNARFGPGHIHTDWKPVFEGKGEELTAAIVSSVFAAERRSLVEILLRFDRLYAEEKRKLGVLDFSDLEHFAIGLLEENHAVRERVQGQFRQILMDEYQDTNGQQARLLDLLRGSGNFYAVGDINQSIFGFRYATPEVFRKHRDQVKSAGDHYVEMFDNFRSREEILKTVETILIGEPGIENHLLDGKRQFALKEVPSVEVTEVHAEDGEQATRMEAEWIAARILELQQSLTFTKEDGSTRPAKFADFAVLARKTAILNPLSEAFDRFGVPYQITRRAGFFEVREIRDLIHLLRAIANPRDEVSLAVVLRSPLAGLSDAALLRMKMGHKNLADGLNLDPGCFDSIDAERLTQFRARFAKWRETAQYTPIDRLLTEAMMNCGYRSMGPDVEKLLGIARSAPRDQALAEFVHEIKLIREEDAREADAPFDDESDSVRVITAHASKGLEFPVVFIPALQSRVGGGADTITFTAEYGLGGKWQDEPDWVRLRNKNVLKRREEAESNRLLYVAMTRAEEHLVLSWAVGGEEKPREWAKVVAQKLGDMVKVVSETDAALRIVREGTFPREPVEIPRPALTGQQESNATVTSLTMFVDCPRRYYLARFLRWDPVRRAVVAEEDRDDAPELDASEIGRQVHALLAGQEVESPAVEAIHLARRFEESELGQRAKKARSSEREWDFMLAVGDMVLRGQVDLWFEERGGAVIVDYKTDDIEASEVEAHAAAYSLQLRYYALAVEGVTGAAPSEAWLYFARLDVAVEVSLGAEELDAARDLVEELASAQRRLEFPLREGSHCLRCPFYRGKCPAA